ncbi:hypothetical protein PCE1_004927 [Barthelona sp. PCE]
MLCTVHASTIHYVGTGSSKLTFEDDFMAAVTNASASINPSVDYTFSSQIVFTHWETTTTEFPVFVVSGQPGKPSDNTFRSKHLKGLESPFPIVIVDGATCGYYYHNTVDFKLQTLPMNRIYDASVVSQRAFVVIGLDESNNPVLIVYDIGSKIMKATYTVTVDASFTLTEDCRVSGSVFNTFRIYDGTSHITIVKSTGDQTKDTRTLAIKEIIPMPYTYDVSQRNIMWTTDNKLYVIEHTEQRVLYEMKILERVLDINAINLESIIIVRDTDTGFAIEDYEYVDNDFLLKSTHSPNIASMPLTLFSLYIPSTFYSLEPNAPAIETAMILVVSTDEEKIWRYYIEKDVDNFVMSNGFPSPCDHGYLSVGSDCYQNMNPDVESSLVIPISESTIDFQIENGRVNDIFYLGGVFNLLYTDGDIYADKVSAFTPQLKMSIGDFSDISDVAGVSFGSGDFVKVYERYDGYAYVMSLGGLISNSFTARLNNMGVSLMRTLADKAITGYLWKDHAVYLTATKVYEVNFTTSTLNEYSHSLDLAANPIINIEGIHDGLFVMQRGIEIFTYAYKGGEAGTANSVHDLPIESCLFHPFQLSTDEVRVFVTCDEVDKVYVGIGGEFGISYQFEETEIPFTKFNFFEHPNDIKIRCATEKYCLMAAHNMLLHISVQDTSITVNFNAVETADAIGIVEIFDLGMEVMTFNFPDGKVARKKIFMGLKCGEDEIPKADYTCEACPVDSHASAGSFTCESCDAAKFEVYMAESHYCRTSIPGEYFNTTTNEILACPVFHECPTNNMTTPIICDSNIHFARGDGHAACVTSCPPGEYYDEERVCTPCPKGNYSTTYSASVCQPAPEGYYVPTEGSTTFEICEAGYFSEEGAFECTWCNPGSFSANEGSGSCSFCPVHHFSSSPASTECTECADDKAADTGALTCKTCASDEKLLPDKSDCVGECPGSLYGYPNGSCIEGCNMYVIPETKSCVEQCPTLMITNETDKTCRLSRTEDGFYWDEETGNTECPPGSYCSMEEKHDCDADLYSVAGSTYASDCRSCGAKHMKKDRSGCITRCAEEGRVLQSGECHDTCPDGSYLSDASLNDNENVCYGCPAGSACKNNTMTSCFEVNTRKYSNSSASECAICPSDMFLKPGHRGCVAECHTSEIPYLQRCVRSCNSLAHYSLFYKPDVTTPNTGSCKVCPAGHRCTPVQEIRCLTGYWSAVGDSTCHHCSGAVSINQDRCIVSDKIITPAVTTPAGNTRSAPYTTVKFNETVTDGITMMIKFSHGLSSRTGHGRLGIASIYKGSRIWFGVSITRFGRGLEVYFNNKALHYPFSIPFSGNARIIELGLTYNFTSNELFMYLDGSVKKLIHSFTPRNIPADTYNMIMFHSFLRLSFRPYPDFNMYNGRVYKFAVGQAYSMKEVGMFFNGEASLLGAPAWQLLLTLGGAYDEISGTGISLPSGFAVKNQAVRMNKLSIHPDTSSGGIVKILSDPNIAYFLVDGFDLDLILRNTEDASEVYEFPVFLNDDVEPVVDIDPTLKSGTYEAMVMTDTQLLKASSTFTKTGISAFPVSGNRLVIEFDEDGEITNMEAQLSELFKDLTDLFFAKTSNLTIDLSHDPQTVDIDALLENTDLTTWDCPNSDVPLNVYIAFNGSSEYIGHTCVHKSMIFGAIERAQDIIQLIKAISSEIVDDLPGTKQICEADCEFWFSGECQLVCRQVRVPVAPTLFKDRCVAWLDGVEYVPEIPTNGNNDDDDDDIPSYMQGKDEEWLWWKCYTKKQKKWCLPEWLEDHEADDPEGEEPIDEPEIEPEDPTDPEPTWTDDLICPKTLACVDNDEYARIETSQASISAGVICVRPLEQDVNATYQCCYESESGDFKKTVPAYNTMLYSMTFKHPEESLDHFFDCCVFSNDIELCERYMTKRPNPKKSATCDVSTCTNPEECPDGVLKPIGGWSDPQIQFLGGNRTKSNGLINSVGDFSLVKNSVFEIQSRHVQYGSGSIFGGFAVKAEASDVSFEISQYTEEEEEDYVEEEEPEFIYIDDEAGVYLTRANISAYPDIEADYNAMQEEVNAFSGEDPSDAIDSSASAELKHCKFLTITDSNGNDVNPCVKSLEMHNATIYTNEAGVCFRFAGSSVCFANPIKSSNITVPLSYSLLLEPALISSTIGVVNPPRELETQRELWTWSMGYNVSVDVGDSIFTSTYPLNTTAPMFTDEVTFAVEEVAAAEDACGELQGMFREACVDDVLLTGDIVFVETTQIAKVVEEEQVAIIETRVVSVSCDPGEKLVDNTCIDCARGYYGDGTSCSVCPENHISTIVGAASCRSCPEGSSSNSMHTACVEGESFPIVMVAVIALVVAALLAVVGMRFLRSKTKPMNKMTISVQPSQMSFIPPQSLELQDMVANPSIEM